MPDFERSRPLRWIEESPPKKILFISHRWRSPRHPDPDGATLLALQGLLRAVVLLAEGIDPSCATKAPDLLEPYMLQASVIVDRLLPFESGGEAVLQHLGIFFDFSCIPQGESSTEREQRLRVLSCFPAFVPNARVILVAVRIDNDRYEQRMWCVAESNLALRFEATRPWADTYPLRVDASHEGVAVTFEPLRKAIENWEKHSSGRSKLSMSDFQRFDRVQVELTRWLSGDRDDAAKLHHTEGSSMASFRMFVNTMLRVAEEGTGVVDLRPAVVDGAMRSGLGCSEPEDYVPAGLLILAGLKWETLNRGGEENCSDLWQSAFDRYCVGAPILAEVNVLPTKGNGAARLPRIRLV